MKAPWIAIFAAASCGFMAGTWTMYVGRLRNPPCAASPVAPGPTSTTFTTCEFDPKHPDADCSLKIPGAIYAAGGPLRATDPLTDPVIRNGDTIVNAGCVIVGGSHQTNACTGKR